MADGVLPRAPITRHLHERAWGRKPSQNWAGAEPSKGPESKGRGELCLGKALVRFTAPSGGAKGANPNHHDPHRWRAGLSDSLEPSRLGGLSKDGSPWLCSHRRHGRSFPVTTDVASGSSRHRLSVTQSWPVSRTCLLQCLELHALIRKLLVICGHVHLIKIEKLSISVSVVPATSSVPRNYKWLVATILDSTDHTAFV